MHKGKVRRYRTQVVDGELSCVEVAGMKPEKKEKKRRKSGSKCPHCRIGVVSIERPMVLRNVFGKIKAARVCEQCKDITDYELLLDLLPYKKWGLARRMLYGVGFVTRERQMFREPIGTWEIRFRGVTWNTFRAGHRDYAREHRSEF